MTDYVTKPIPAQKPSVQFVERPWGRLSSMQTMKR